MRVLGIDSSLTSTGLATVWASSSTLVVDTEACTTTARKGDGTAEKLARMNTQVDRVKALAGGASLVLLEGPSFASKGSATRDLAGLWWLIFNALRRAGCPLGIVPPSVLKKWVTGSGNADKFRVGQAIAKRWPEVELRTPDEADALGLASMGLHHGGLLPWQPTAYQAEQIGRVEWLESTR
jgi:Holliday junction resolvasome RuvABC endonuclease subunit